MTARGSMCERRCKCCGARFAARVADVKRGWAKFCSKSCKAKKREQRTGQYAAYLHGKPSNGAARPMFSDDDWAHPFSSDGLGQW